MTKKIMVPLPSIRHISYITFVDIVILCSIKIYRSYSGLPQMMTYMYEHKLGMVLLPIKFLNSSFHASFIHGVCIELNLS